MGGDSGSRLFSAGCVKSTKAIAGRFEDSLIAKCIPSNRHPWRTHSLRVFSNEISSTVESSTTLYRAAPGDWTGAAARAGGAVRPVRREPGGSAAFDCETFFFIGRTLATPRLRCRNQLWTN